MSNGAWGNEFGYELGKLAALSVCGGPVVASTHHRFVSSVHVCECVDKLVERTSIKMACDRVERGNKNRDLN